MLTSSVTLGKWFKPSEPSFPHMLIEIINNTFFIVLLLEE